MQHKGVQQVYVTHFAGRLDELVAFRRKILVREQDGIRIAVLAFGGPQRIDTFRVIGEESCDRSHGVSRH